MTVRGHSTVPPTPKPRDFAPADDARPPRRSVKAAGAEAASDFLSRAKNRKGRPLDLEGFVEAVTGARARAADEALTEAERRETKAERENRSRRLLWDLAAEEAKGDEFALSVLDSAAAAQSLRDANGLVRGEEENAEYVPSLLGLRPFDVAPSRSDVREFKSSLAPLVARRIEAKRERLLQFVDPTKMLSKSDSRRPLTDAVSAVVSRHDAAASALQEETAQLESFVRKLLVAHERLVDHGTLLLREHLPAAQKEETSRANWLLARARCLKAKANLIEVRTHGVVYPKKTVKILKTIRYKLDKKIDEVDRNHRRFSRLAAEYASLGENFNLLADEYRSLLKKIESQKFVLREYEKEETGTE